MGVEYGANRPEIVGTIYPPRTERASTTFTCLYKFNGEKEGDYIDGTEAKGKGNLKNQVGGQIRRAQYGFSIYLLERFFL